MKKIVAAIVTVKPYLALCANENYRYNKFILARKVNTIT